MGRTSKPKINSKLLKKAITDVFKQHPNKPFNHKQILKRLNSAEIELPDSFYDIEAIIVRPIIVAMLEKLEEEGDLLEIGRGKYKLIPEESIVEGILDFTTHGSAYLMNEDYEDDIFIRSNDTSIGLHGDRVKVSLFAHKPGRRMHGEVVEIVQRAQTRFAGIVHMSDRFAFVVPDGGRMTIDFFVPPAMIGEAEHGQKVIVELQDWDEDSKNPIGKIVEILGMPGENEAEMHAILAEFGFPSKFPDKIEKEASKLPVRITKKEISNRRDFREVTTFTIDPHDAKDFDDALSVEELENGNYEIGIHIADVTHYLKEGSALDKEAAKRATSVYLVDRVVPMLPEILSNNVCSLRPEEEKLCFSAVFEINEKSEVLNQWFGRTVIYSDHRFTYEQAQAIIEGGNGPLKKEILLLDRLAKNLREERFNKGAINFEKQEVKFHLDEVGKPTGVYIKESKDANKLIEEFMLLANKKVAALIAVNTAVNSKKAFIEVQSRKGQQGKSAAKTFVFRVHDIPSTEKLSDFANFAKKFGHKFQMGTEQQVRKNLNKLMSNIKGSAEQNVLEQLAIRSMAKAIYTTENIGHYGLAFEHYTHFTSPIRRYPDVLVHRLLQQYIDNGRSANAKALESQCQHSTEMEIRASQAERTSVKYKQAEYLMDREGEVFNGIISGVTEWGIYVELVESKCEGLVRLRTISGDYYDFDERNFCIRGHRTGKKFQLGDEVKVILAGVDLVKKQIDFELYDLELEMAAPMPRRDRRKKRKGKKRR